MWNFILPLLVTLAMSSSPDWQSDTVTYHVGELQVTVSI